MKKEFKWWMGYHIWLWRISTPIRSHMYDFSLSNGFDKCSSYWTARLAKKELIESILIRKKK